jgi:hypothetical protein
MSFLLKVVLFGIILIYIFRKIFDVIDHLTGRKSRQDQVRMKKEGEIRVDHHPDKKGGRFGSQFKGGEYVDYEELK